MATKKYMTMDDVYNITGIKDPAKEFDNGTEPSCIINDLYTRRSEILSQANDIIMGSRNTSYGQPEDNFQLIADYWSMYLVNKGKMNTVLSSEDITIMMILLKIARMGGKGTVDCFIDIAGYAACGGEIHSKNVISNELTGSSSS